MKSSGIHWRRFIVDVLIGAATVAVMFAATGATAEVPYVLLVAGALIGIGLMLEPHFTEQPASDIASQPIRPSAEAKTARSGPWVVEGLDIVEAASA